LERTLVLIKPDAVQRGLIGEITSRLENKGLKISGMKLMKVSEELAGRHYGEHVGKPFFDALVNFITSSPIVALAIDGDNAVAVVRNVMGATNPQDAANGSIRGDLGLSIGMNLIHGSDSPTSSERELALFFDESELLDYDRDVDNWIIE
jgi:nucleoside-diphosphate kinase|tara:strand:- start:613 stop:1062 length:450 start_codon:yes stop_codon:yes gene_type:complete